ncbi:MAG: cell wall metabolism sensor histidine kinase WalK [Candidatus Obscuribacterales bacterium]|nr:cell wall metabolism sensor histidine kinase WalK [Candidatus Obscuribacterales bacterium]
MNSKRIHLSLFQKALVLVAVPLAFELLLLGTLSFLLAESERETRAADRAKEIIAQTNTTIQEFFDVGFAFIAFDARSLDFFEHRLNRLLKKLPADIENLKILVQDNPKYLAIVNHVSNESSESIRWISAAAKKSKDGAKLDVTEALEMRGKLNRIVSELDEIIREEKQEQRKNPQAAEHLKLTLKVLLAVGIVMSILIALLLVLIFHQSTTRRLKSLMTNSLRLGRDSQLAPLLEGNDEIARIDRSFHEAAAALNEARRRELAVIDNAVDVICSINAESKFSKVSPASLKLFDYEPAELINQPFSKVIYEADLEKALKWVENLKSSENRAELETRILRKDGTIAEMLWSAHWSASENAIFCVVHDITDRNELERLKQQFVSMISHDLRTPLSAVKSTLALLGAGAWGDLTEKGLQKVTMAEKSLRDSIELINNLLDLDKMESGTIDLQVQNISLSELLRDCAGSLSSLAEQRAIAIKIPEIECRALADPKRLSQVLINLLGNALKFSPSGSEVALKIDAEDSFIKVGIIDQGPGVKAEEQESIFQRFHQAPETAEKAREGTGLGLAICKAIIEAHGGNIGVESDGKNGSKFWFRLPCPPEKEA